MKKIFATTIGNQAKKIISEDQNASVLGQTSRGIFLKTSGRWQIFISFEAYRGPLSINIPSSPRFSLKQGQQAILSSDAVRFPSAEIAISFETVKVWHPPSPPPRKTKGFTPLHLLPHLKKYISPDNILFWLEYDAVSNLSAFQKALLPVVQNITSSQWDQSAKEIDNILGLGSGLTPLADDFIIGVLLCLRRWNWQGSQMKNAADQIVNSAYAKTTTLSANLIECAAYGMADERIINACDSLASGAPQPDEAIQELLTWGSTSGIGVLAGIASAIVKDKKRET
jgi:hypothetical protein